VDGTGQAVSNSATADATLSGVSKKDVYVEATIGGLTSVGQYAGLAARYSGPGDTNMYWGAIGKTGATTFTAVIYKNVSGTWSLVASQAIGSSIGLGKLRFEVVGDSQKLFLDDGLKLFTFDSSI